MHRADERYEERDRSAVLPDLDLALLASFVVAGASQTQQVKAYRRALRAAASRSGD